MNDLVTPFTYALDYNYTSLGPAFDTVEGTVELKGILYLERGMSGVNVGVQAVDHNIGYAGSPLHPATKRAWAHEVLKNFTPECTTLFLKCSGDLVSVKIEMIAHEGKLTGHGYLELGINPQYDNERVRHQYLRIKMPPKLFNKILAIC